MITFYAHQIEGETAWLDAEESHHCQISLRKKSGDKIYIADGKGHIWEGMVTLPDKKQTKVSLDKLIRFIPETPSEVYLAVAPTKNMDRYEWLIEKAVELGIRGIAPVITKRTERTKINMDRLSKIALSAFKQSLQGYLPVISEPVTYDQYLKKMDNHTSKYIAYCGVEGLDHLNEIADNTGGTILIGPEGDFTEDEYQQAIKGNWKGISLGSQRLRTETAALAAGYILKLKSGY